MILCSLREATFSMFWQGLPLSAAFDMTAVNSKLENSHLPKSLSAAFVYKYLSYVSHGVLPTFSSSSLPLSLPLQCELSPQLCYTVPTWQLHLMCHAFPHRGGSAGLCFIANSTVTSPIMSITYFRSVVQLSWYLSSIFYV